MSVICTCTTIGVVKAKYAYETEKREKIKRMEYSLIIYTYVDVV